MALPIPNHFRYIRNVSRPFRNRVSDYQNRPWPYVSQMHHEQNDEQQSLVHTGQQRVNTRCWIWCVHDWSCFRSAGEIYRNQSHPWVKGLVTWQENLLHPSSELADLGPINFQEQNIAWNGGSTLLFFGWLPSTAKVTVTLSAFYGREGTRLSRSGLSL